MKNFFGKKSAQEKEVGIDRTGFPEPIDPNNNDVVIPENVAEAANMEDVKNCRSVKTEEGKKPIWKTQNFLSRNDLVGFLNENSIDPEYMVPGANGSFNIFYKE